MRTRANLDISKFFISVAPMEIMFMYIFFLESVRYIFLARLSTNVSL